MTDGVSATNAGLMATAAVSANWAFAQLHKGAFGSAGTTNVSSVTTRPAVTWGSQSGGVIAANGTLPSWASWAGTNGESQTGITGWSSGTPGAGTYGGGITLSAPVTMNTGDSLSLTAISVTVPTVS